MSNTPKILYSAPEAAKEVTVTGFADITGRFWGKDEHMARWCSCTHIICACGKEVEKNWTICNDCRYTKARAKYQEMEFEEWDGKSYLYCNLHDHYFSDLQEVADFCEDKEIEASALELIICEPQYARQIDDDFFCDELPEDMSFADCATDAAVLALDAFNEAVKGMILSWRPGDTRTTIDLTPAENP